MAEANGEIPLTGDPRVDAALKRIRGKFQNLEDAMLVQAYLEKAQSEQIKQHAVWLANHEETMKAIDIRLSDISVKLSGISVKMDEMTEKVDFLLNREMKREGGPEAGEQ